ncbi:MAG: dienelactone hydrolase family protein [Casimicrobiaceae bacterium]
MNEAIESHVRSLTGDRKVDRRNFVVTTLGAGFDAFALPGPAQTISTSTEGLVAGEVKVKTSDGEMPAYRAMPATGGNFPVVLVVSEVWGVHEYIKDVTRRVAKNGYFAIAPELFARQGNAASYTDTSKLLAEIVSKASDKQVMGDLDACVAFAKDSGKAETARLGITGFCWGGRIVYMYAAHNPNVKAGVAWYGATARAFFQGDKTALDVAGQIKAPILGLYGAADQGIPNDTVEKMYGALKAAGSPRSEYTLYPDTPHAFHADYRPSYRKERAEDAWNKMLAWFKLNL